MATTKSSIEIYGYQQKFRPRFFSGDDLSPNIECIMPENDVRWTWIIATELTHDV